MKTLSKIGLMITIGILMSNNSALASTNPTISIPVVSVVATETISSDILLHRLQEIKDMDKSNLTRTEKRALRKEIRTLKASMADSRNGLYISLGAAIIIVLLLILIL